MSADIEELPWGMQQEGLSSESSKKVQLLYSRDFLLKFREHEACQKLPKDFDESILSEINETPYYVTQDRPRGVGSYSLQGFKRTDYSSSPPTRGDSGSFSRGNQRWDNRSSGRIDGDSDSEPGRRYGTQARRSWQNSEHDGLLGSGSFPRPPGYTGGVAQRFRPPNETYNLSKSNEPYHPPRPYKAVPHYRRDTHDSFNDETFGSADDTGDDRVEEEKKRRAEFEQMRLEAHKAFQEKQKANSGKPKDSFSDLAGLLEDPNDSKFSSDLDKVVKEAPKVDAGKLPVPSQAAPVRPLVPPGFVSSVADKSSAFKPPVNPDPLQARNLEPVSIHQEVKGIAQERSSSDLHHETPDSSDFKSENSFLSVVPSVDQKDEIIENREVLGLDSDVNRQRVPVVATPSASILDKLFSNTSTTSSEIISDVVEGHDPKADDIWSPDQLQSKFAHWFREEENKTSKDVPMEKPSSLLSLIIGGEKGASDGANSLVMGSILSPEILLGQNSSNSSSVTGEIVGQFGNSTESNSKPSVLTCEDLEQSILLEIGGVFPNSQPPKKKEVASKVKDVLPGTNVDNLASQHLLSLLQSGANSNNAASISSLDDKYGQKHEVSKLPLCDGNFNIAGAVGLNSSDKTLTLECLLGTAFLNELHSAHKNSVGSARMDVSDGTIFPPKLSESGTHFGHDEGSILASNDGIANADKVADWLGFQDAGKELEFSSLRGEVDSEFSGFNGANGIKLPQEDSLIHITGPNSSENFWVSNSSSFNAELRSSSNMPDYVIERLSSLGSAVKGESSIAGAQGPHLLQGPYDMGKPEPPYQNLRPHASAPQLHASLMNQGRPLFHPLDSHRAHLDPHLNITPPETVLHRDAPVHHQFSGTMGNPSFPNAGLPGFDHPIPHQVLQQMHLAGNLHPPHLVRGFPGSAPMPPHLGHSPSFIQEHNPMQGFPFVQRQPNFGGPRISPPGPEIGVGSNPPEAFQRLMEMELRANPNPIPKQMHPFSNGGPSRAMYGHELETGLRYR